MWPFNKPVGVEDRAYTEAITEARISAAEGTDVDVSGLAVREIAAGLYARAFAQADVSGTPVLLPEDTLALVGRMLAERGACVLYLGDGEPVPASSWDIGGSSINPLSWRYRLTLPFPGGSKGKHANALDVLHFRINATAARPWEGRSPFAVAKDTAKLAFRAENALCSEMNTPVGGVLPVPSSLAQPTRDSLGTTIRGLKGAFVPLESTRDGLASTGNVGGAREYAATRYKPEPDDATIKVWSESTQSLLAAAGIPVELATNAEGSSTREAWRRFLHSTIDPMGRMVVAELRRKLTGSPVVSFDRLFASDLSGRARAFQSMIGGGLSLQQAAIHAGLTDVDAN